MIDYHSVLAAFNFLDATIFVACFAIVFSLILDYKRANDVRTFRECLEQIWTKSDGVARPAIGFLFLCAGVILKAIIRVPILALDAQNNEASMRFVLSTVAPYFYAASSILFCVGIGFIMWPTLGQLASRIFGARVKPEEDSGMSLALFVVIIVTALFSGYYFHTVLVNLIHFMVT